MQAKNDINSIKNIHFFQITLEKLKLNLILYKNNYY